MPQLVWTKPHNIRVPGVVSYTRNAIDGFQLGDIALPGSSSFANVNRPSGLTTMMDDDFDYVLTTGNDAAIRSELQAAGWDDPGSANVVENYVSSVSMSGTPNDPGGGKYVLKTVYADGRAGGGATLQIQKTWGANYKKGYAYVAVYYEAGFDHNNASEKLIYFRIPGSPQLLIENHDGSICLYQVPQNPADEGPPGDDGSCYCNQVPGGLVDYPADDTWVEYEFYFDHSGGTNNGIFKMWKDGTLIANHVGRTLNVSPHGVLTDIWGGSGVKSGNEGRRVDRVIFAVGN